MSNNSSTALAPNQTLFAITHIDKDGLRRLTFANEGRNHYANKRDAEDYLRAINKNTGNERLAQIFGAQSLNTFKVLPVECYWHGDAVGIYFED